MAARTALHTHQPTLLHIELFLRLVLPLMKSGPAQRATATARFALLLAKFIQIRRFFHLDLFSARAVAALRQHRGSIGAA